jgi:hypothetical protein
MAETRRIGSVANDKETAEATSKETEGASQPAGGIASAGSPPQPQVRVDTSNLKSTYCNVCNGASTREEVVLTFGVNQDWDLATQMREIHLHHRIILSPFAAKRLQDLITTLMKEHETRYGVLKTA